MARFKIHPVSLGCPKNLVDTEGLLGLLSNLGGEPVERPEDADVILINTCAFIASAVEESVQTILELADFKGTGGKLLVVFGCLPQRYGEELAASLPEVDVFWGTGGLDTLARRIRRRLSGPLEACLWPAPGYAPASPGPRLRAAPFFRSYLKIAEGCSNACTYCLIPELRGPLRSRPMGALVEEAHALAESGVRELILVAQDTTAYGRDLTSRDNPADLLTALARVPGLAWLRLMYAYPNGLTNELLEVMAGEDKVCGYLDLPLQHAAPAVLKRMGRKGSRDLDGLIERIRRKVPGITLRTTLMVGFPGETDEEFALLRDFVARSRFDRLGVFKFCAEDGVRASGFPNQVPQRVKETRRRRIMADQRRISGEINRASIGAVAPVLVEGRSPETDLLFFGRTRGQAPDIDGVVYINDGTARPGDIQMVEITEAHDYDLVGRIVEDPSMNDPAPA